MGKEDCHPPKSLGRAVMMCSGAFKKNPNVVFKDGQAAHDLGAYAAYRRLNGDTYTLVGDPKDPSKAGSIRCYDQDDHLQHEWVYSNLAQAWDALRAWLPDREESPTGWVTAYRRSPADNTMVPEESAFPSH